MIGTGHIRGSAIEIIVEASVKTDGELTTRLHGPDDQIVRTFYWPRDFTVTSADSGTLRIPLSDAPSPLVSVEVSCNGQPLEFASWHLHALYPRSPKQFEGLFYRRKNRVSDHETQLFSALQVVRYYRSDITHVSVAAVVAGYRLIDRNDIVLLAEWTRLTSDLLERLENSAKSTWQPRSDRDHQIGSLVMVRWLILLAQGRSKHALQTLDLYVSRLELFDDATSPSVILNACLMLLIRAQMAFIAGDVTKSTDLYMRTHSIYVRYLPRLKPSAIWFREMTLAHTAVTFALDAYERVQNHKKGLNSLLVFHACHRVQSDTGKKLIEDKFSILCRQLRKQSRLKKLAHAAHGSEND